MNRTVVCPITATIVRLIDEVVKESCRRPYVNRHGQASADMIDQRLRGARIRRFRRMISFHPGTIGPQRIVTTGEQCDATQEKRR
ncbi:MAG: hypothetical protein OXU64_08585 [Gemmatimonadota bacterium]|nr:hypothetical protein [Gemmatimonadota bacterium]